MVGWDPRKGCVGGGLSLRKYNLESPEDFVKRVQRTDFEHL
jgi:hypothetical protein